MRCPRCGRYNSDNATTCWKCEDVFEERITIFHHRKPSIGKRRHEPSHEYLNRSVRFFILIAHKAANSMIIIFLVMSILFFLLHSIPGGDMVTRVCPFCGAEEKMALRHEWGLDQPLLVQYMIYLKKVFTFDYRIYEGQVETSISQILFLLPYTLLLFGSATLLIYVLGIFLGPRLLSGTSKLKRTVSLVSIVFYTIPAFVLALSFKNWFIFRYHIFVPVNSFNKEATSLVEYLINIKGLLSPMVLPLLILVLVGIARPLLLLKDHIELLLHEPFITAARAKGLTETEVLSRHAARNALLPFMSDASINLALIISGGILVEYIFQWPGIGGALFLALRTLDYFTISAAIFLLTVILLLSLTVIDVLYAYLDPRVMT